MSDHFLSIITHYQSSLSSQGSLLQLLVQLFPQVVYATAYTEISERLRTLQLNTFALRFAKILTWCFHSYIVLAPNFIIFYLGPRRPLSNWNSNNIFPRKMWRPEVDDMILPDNWRRTAVNRTFFPIREHFIVFFIPFFLRSVLDIYSHLILGHQTLLFSLQLHKFVFELSSRILKLLLYALQIYFFFH